MLGNLLGRECFRVVGSGQLAPHDVEAELLDARFSVEPSANDSDLFGAVQPADSILGGYLAFSLDG